MDLRRVRANTDPRCANCGWWVGRVDERPAAACERHGLTTLDLAVCSDWRDGEPVQDILPPGKDDDDA